ncbi:hypothetical protein [Thalassospira xiamenensis]|uniref:Chromosome segregation ATPase n=1 Tax=Thalassospira xiamenensis TaxID=220697 RepID=A0A285TYU2_9PROT|nr:hypothetical protein [Thalassospira xiamenensis]SOC31397.1 Chromosome segregation ATPase [Thalassospira xiamenensis]
MAVVNRFEIANYMNLTNEPAESRNWEPGYRHVLTKEFNGRNVAVVATNGVGKTTLVRTILAILSRHQTFVKMLRKRAAPQRKGRYSHIRMEFVHSDKPLSDDLIFRSDDRATVDGERYVYGVYLNYDSDIWFYAYQGTLEDCPCAIKTGDFTEIVPNDTFRETLKQQKGYVDGKAIGRAAWENEVRKIMDKSTLDQLVHYQLAGGGEGGKDFFALKGAHNEKTYAAEFFYEHLAPQLLVHVMGEEGEHDEVSFETTICKTSKGIFSAERKADQAAEELQRIQHSHELFEEINWKLKDYVGQVTRHQELSQSVAAEAALIEQIVARDPIFGMPDRSAPINESQKFFVERLVLHKGEWLIPDWALAEVFGITPGHVNEVADRKSVVGIKLGNSQVIEKHCDSGRSAVWPVQGGSPKKTFYSFPAAMKIVQNASNFAGDWTKDRVQNALNFSLKWLEENDRPNALRLKARALADKRHEMDKEILEIEKVLDAQIKERDELQGQLRAADAAREAFNAMAASSHYSEEEMQRPLEAGERAQAAYDDAKKQRERHQQKRASLRDRHEEYLTFVERYGQDTNPENVLRDLQNQKSAAEAAVKKAQDAKSAAQKALRIFIGVQEQVEDILRRQETAKVVAGQLRDLAAESSGYVAIFGDESALELEARLKEEGAASQKALNDLRQKFEFLQDEICRLDAFAKDYPGKTPSDLIFDRQRQMAELIVRQKNTAEELDHQKERLASWEMAKVAPGRVAKQTTDIVKAANMTCVPLHEVVIQAAGTDTERKAALLTYFSSVLFAPVVATKDEAVAVATALADADHEAPVFLHSEVAKFCAGNLEGVSIADDGRTVFNYMLGVRTRPVDCLLDPLAIEAEKKRLREAITSLETDLSNLNTRIASLQPTTDLGRRLTELEALVQSDPRNAVVHLQPLLTAATERVRIAIERSSDGNITLVRARRRFEEGGGQKRLDELKADIERLDTDRLTLTGELGDQTLDQVEKVLSQTNADLERQDANLTEIRVKLSDAGRLQMLALFVRDGDLTFMEKAQEVEASLRQDENQKEMRLGHPQRFNFQLAQHAVELGKVSEEDLARKVNGLQLEIKAGKEKVNSLRTEIRKTVDAVPRAEADADKLERLVASLQSDYRRMKQALSEMGDALSLSVEGQDGSLSRIYGYLKDLSIYVDEGRLEEALDYVEGIVEGIDDLKIDSRIKEISESRKLTERALRVYVKALESAEKDKNADFDQSERNILRNACQDPTGKGMEDIQGFYKHIEQELVKARDVHEKSVENVQEATKSLDISLHTFMNKLDENFEQMKRDLKWKIKDGEIIEAGIEIEASIVDDTHREAALKQVLDFVRQEDRRRAEDKSTGLISKNDEAAFQEHLEARIRNLLYRHIFKSADGSMNGPKINLRHPAFNPSKAVPFNGNFSQGQKDALTLMLLIKLADFSMNRDMYAFSTPGSRKRKKQSNQTKIIFIDGLFSNLSDGELCEKALEPLKRTRGNFQLIGFIHNKDYKNDDKQFPNLVHFVKVGGNKGKYVHMRHRSPGELPEIVSTDHEEVVAIGCHVAHAPQTATPGPS